MPEEFNGKTVFTLFEVAQSIRETIAKRYQNSYWVKAELNKLNYYPHSGHCYPELVEKRDDKVVAQMRSNLWRDDFSRINESFLRTVNEPVKDGIKILFQAKIEFHPEYGLALRILDIDPGYTLGDLEREKREAIKKLQEEGLINKNKMLKMPLLPQRIAIISVESSKGYADLLQVFEKANKSWRYYFFHLLFPALLQGDHAVLSILKQLKRIKKAINHFDVVAIVRGGGGDIGLSCYNNYALAKEISLFPIPVITGIGHATNQTVAEMVAYENAITPTKLAEFIVQKFHNFSVPLQKGQDIIIDKSRRIISEEKTKLQSGIKLFSSVIENGLLKNKHSLHQNIQYLVQQLGFIFKTEREWVDKIPPKIIRTTEAVFRRERKNWLQLVKGIKKDTILKVKNWMIELNLQVKQIQSSVKGNVKNQQAGLVSMEKNLNNLSPSRVLKRGYSITRVNGKAITSYKQVRPGDTLNTDVYEGEIISTVSITAKPNQE